LNGLLEFRIIPKLGQTRFLRRDVRVSLERSGFPRDRVGEVVLVVDEIVTNAIEHGSRYRQPTDELIIRLGIDGGSVDVEFIDPSMPADAVDELVRLLAKCGGESPPPIDSERGRGLFLIHDGLDVCEVEVLPDGVGVSMRGRMFRVTG
jgi:anti-sigma regulatory factor (Ser/Thr protein kinase)